MKNAYAKSAILSDNIDINRIPFTDLREDIKKRATVETKNLIKPQADVRGKLYFQQYFNDHKYPWYEHKHFKREFVVAINRIGANHYNLVEFLARIRIITNPDCKYGTYTEDINQVVWQCPLYNKQRSKFINNLKKIRIYLPMNV